MRLDVRDDALVALPSDTSSGLYIRAFERAGERWTVLTQPVAYFIPHVPDPSQRTRGEELWVEVTVPPTRRTAPDPARGEEDGLLTPLELR